MPELLVIYCTWEQLKILLRLHPLHFYIAGFYCHEQRFVIEVDGGAHMLEKQKENDENRTGELEKFGDLYKTIHLHNPPL